VFDSGVSSLRLGSEILGLDEVSSGADDDGNDDDHDDHTGPHTLGSGGSSDLDESGWGGSVGGAGSLDDGLGDVFLCFVLGGGGALIIGEGCNGDGGFAGNHFAGDLDTLGSLVGTGGNAGLLGVLKSGGDSIGEALWQLLGITSDGLGALVVGEEWEVKFGGIAIETFDGSLGSNNGLLSLNQIGISGLLSGGIDGISNGFVKWGKLLSLGLLLGIGGLGIKSVKVTCELVSGKASITVASFTDEKCTAAAKDKKKADVTETIVEGTCAANAAVPTTFVKVGPAAAAGEGMGTGMIILIVVICVVVCAAGYFVKTKYFGAKAE
jgi:hypothetical protein